jgi:uncharacterized membrane protein YcaP (DUF421 family)
VSLHQLFGETGNVTWAQECARAVVVFFYGLLLVRLSGRRVFGEWSALDIIVSIMVGSNLSRAITGSAALWGTIAATTLLMVLHWTLAHAAARWPVMSHVFEGRAKRLAAEGRLDETTLKHHAVSEADLKEALRGAGVESVDDARIIMLEPSGKISVLKKPSTHEGE